MTELEKLEAYLKEHGYNYKRKDDDDEDEPNLSWHQIIVYDKTGRRMWDAVCHPGSYGFEYGRLEIMGKPVVRKSDFDCVVGYLTAQDIIDRLEDKDE